MTRAKVHGRDPLRRNADFGKDVRETSQAASRKRSARRRGASLLALALSLARSSGAWVWANEPDGADPAVTVQRIANWVDLESLGSAGFEIPSNDAELLKLDIEKRRPMHTISRVARAERTRARRASSKRAASSPMAKPEVDGSFVEETVVIPVFGRVSVYRSLPIDPARGVVLFVSGDGGWNKGVVDMARRVASRTLVVGLSMPAWQKRVEARPGRCWYPAGELESAAQAIEKLYRFPSYVKPVLAGYSSGATVVYGALAQAPPDTFAGAVSLGFCADLEVGRPFCGRGEWKPTYDARKKRIDLPPSRDIAPSAGGGARWIALQGSIDQVCDSASVHAFTAKVPASRIVPLERVGHGFSVPRRWGAAYDDAIASLLELADLRTDPATSALRERASMEGPVAAGTAGGGTPGVGSDAPSSATIQERLGSLGLPLEVEWPQGAHEALVFVSGDGGWAELDRRVSEALAAHGVAVVGWNTLRYFWEEKSPERFRADLARVLDALPADVRVFAGGYSFGAEVVPIACAAGEGERPAALERIEGLVLLDPGAFASFEVSPLDWIRTSHTATQFPVPRALQGSAGPPILCVLSTEADDTGCPGQDSARVTRVVLPGGHHFSGDFEGIAKIALGFMHSSRSSKDEHRDRREEHDPGREAHDEPGE